MRSGRSEDASLVCGEHVDPLDIPWIIQGLASKIVHKTHSYHEPVSLARVKLIPGIQCVCFLVLYDLRTVPGHQMLELDDCKQEEEVVKDDGNQSTVVALHGMLTPAVELRQCSWEHVGLNEHLWQANSS